MFSAPKMMSAAFGPRFASAAIQQVFREKRLSNALFARSLCSKTSVSQVHKSRETKEKNWIRDSIIQRIEVSGPLTVADYMRIVLTSPTSGFYMKQDVFGSKGHFTTSPEVSQIFGELVAVWLINEWQRFNANKPFRIIELGPGRGTLALDISRVLAQFRHSRECASLHLVEISPYLTQVQEQTLCGHLSVRNKEFKGTHNSLTKTGLPVTWYQTLDQVPNSSGFSVFIAHEFLDALPIHKFQRNENHEWREVLINVDQNKELQFMLSKNPTPASKYFIPAHIEGNHFEVCPEAITLTEKVVKRINANDGCFLICDYGYATHTAKRDTFRAFREHTLWDPLKEPGTADLTADVDFNYLKSHVSDKATTFGPVNQKVFLQSLGIELRLQKLLENANEKEAKELRSGVDMILNDMGERFKFLSLFPKSAEGKFKDNPSPGFV